MTVKNVFLQLEKLFGRNPEAYLIQLMNDGLIDIANRKQGYTVSATTDLEQKKRWYTLPPTVLSIERVEVLDSNDRYIMIPKLSDPHKLLRADSDSSNEALKKEIIWQQELTQMIILHGSMMIRDWEYFHLILHLQLPQNVQQRDMIHSRELEI